MGFSICRAAAVSALIMSFASSASAGQCGTIGWSHGHGSEQSAVNSAQNGCGWACSIVRTFYNSCAAIAVADNGAWGWAYEKNRELAESSAVNYCMDNGYNCRVQVWSCSF